MLNLARGVNSAFTAKELAGEGGNRVKGINYQVSTKVAGNLRFFFPFSATNNTFSLFAHG